MIGQQSFLTLFGLNLYFGQALSRDSENQSKSEVNIVNNTITRDYPTPSLLSIRFSRLKKVIKKRESSIL